MLSTNLNQDTNNHLEGYEPFYGSLNSAMDNLNESLTDTNKYREEISNCSGNLASGTVSMATC